ncbi:hypothetical protein [Allofustis seminis]|uniref:hypothetical protein n=1 Tax=Allofustis seminis TaxID=166939 RepID=UPI000367E1AC|nr:hypothetical protein [Allofustis seminis]
MKKFFNLFAFEYNRLTKILFPGLLIALGIEGAALCTKVYQYTRSVKHVLLSNPTLSTDEVLTQVNGQFSVGGFFESPFLFFPLLGIAAIFVFYAIYTWYRDWFGKNTFIYRLLMLPVPRLFVYCAKVLAFLVGGLTALMAQFLAFYLFEKIVILLVAPEYLDPTPITLFITSIMPSALFYSNEVIDIVSLFLSSISFLSVLFTMILAERSFRMKGLLAGALLFGAYLASYVFVSTHSLFYTVFHFYLLPSEQLMGTLLVHTVWLILSAFISRYLLEQKVTV